METRAHRSHRPLTQAACEIQDFPSNAKKLIQMNITASNTLWRALPKGRVPHVCIVGAGFAGLRCADVLSQRGLKVTILEGRDRIGGRVHQNNQSGHVFDLGPNWIHGTDHNPILDLAKETKDTRFSVPDVAPSMYNESGHLVDNTSAQRYYDLVWGMISDAFKHSHEKCASIPSDTSLMDFFRSKAKEKKFDDDTTKFVLQIARMWGDFVGEPIEKQSLKFFWLEECIEGENLFLASTYKAILNKVSKAALATADLRLSTKVTSISANQKPDESSSINVTTASNQTIGFDEVIVTCPLGWLKRNLSSFSPPLPTAITKAIQQISYGRLEKVYLTFPVAFWDHGRSAETTKPFFTQFLGPTYSDQNPNHWTLECVSLASLPRPYDHTTLLFYINGPCAQHVTSLINGLEPTSKEYYPRLNDFFAPYYTRLPNHDPSSRDCKPSSILATNWQNDEFAGFGSYSTFQTSKAEEKVQLDKDIEALREGYPDRGIWFAGEHTAPFVALGTTTGAYWSGEAVAERVAGVYGMSGERKDGQFE